MMRTDLSMHSPPRAGALLVAFALADTFGFSLTAAFSGTASAGAIAFDAFLSVSALAVAEFAVLLLVATFIGGIRPTSTDRAAKLVSEPG
jgi:hypothetical protein